MTKLRNAYLTQISTVIRMAEEKVGKDTAQCLRDLLATPSFRHNGIINADKETLEWAAAQITMSTCPLDVCQDYIEWDDKAEMLINNGRKLMIVFTDGSANAINADMLAYGGWGFFLHSDSDQNKGSARTGKPTTSFRAEVRAVLEVIWRTREPACIITNCKSVDQVLNDMLGKKCKEKTWSGLPTTDATTTG